MFLRILICVLFFTQSKGQELKDASDLNSVEIVGIGENCGERSFCDAKLHLVCVTYVCACNDGEGYTLDESSMRCTSNSSITENKDSESDSSEESIDETPWALPVSVEDNSTENEDSNVEDITIGGIELIEQQESKKDTNGSPNVVAAESTIKVLGKNSETNDESKPKATPDSSEKDDDEDDWWEDDEEDTGNDDHSYESESTAEKDEDEDHWWGGDYEDTFEWPLQDDVKEFNVKCSVDLDCTNSTLGVYSVCGENQTCKCANPANSMEGVILVNQTCYLLKHIQSECFNHKECDAVIDGSAWCHRDIADLSGPGVCACQPFHIWNEEMSSCLPIWMEGESTSCVSHDQCRASEALGPFSRCSEDNGTCECLPSGLGPNEKDIIPFEGKCLIKKEFGEDCDIDQECVASLGEGTSCDPHRRVCACQPGRFCIQMLRRPLVSGFTGFILLAIAITVFVSSIVCFIMRRNYIENRYSVIEQHTTP